MNDIDPLLVIEVEAAMRLPVCANPWCKGPADWTLIAPCGHTTRWCDICHMESTETIGRLIDAGEPYVCPRDDVHGWWAEFRWETTP